MALDLSSLQSAVRRLAEGLDELAESPERTLLRDGVIQRFEFTYELSHRCSGATWRWPPPTRRPWT